MAFGDLPGAQSEYMRVPEADLTLRKIPDETALGDEDMLFVGDILTTGYDAVRKADMQPGDVVAVVGCGPVGLCTVMAARALGAGQGRRDRHGARAAEAGREPRRDPGQPEGDRRRRRRAAS